MVRDRCLSIQDQMWLKNQAPPEYIDGWYEHYCKYPPSVVLQGIGFGTLTSVVVNFAKSFGKNNDNATQPSDIFPFLAYEKKERKNESHFSDMMEMMAERPT